MEVFPRCQHECAPHVLLSPCPDDLCSHVRAGGRAAVGTAAIKINPPVGIPLAGYYSPRGSEGVLEDLYVKVAVLDDGQTQAALVVCDLITVPRTRCLKPGSSSSRRPSCRAAT